MRTILGLDVEFVCISVMFPLTKFCQWIEFGTRNKCQHFGSDSDHLYPRNGLIQITGLLYYGCCAVVGGMHCIKHTFRLLVNLITVLFAYIVKDVGQFR